MRGNVQGERSGGVKGPDRQAFIVRWRQVVSRRSFGDHLARPAKCQEARQQIAIGRSYQCTCRQSNRRLLTEIDAPSRSLWSCYASAARSLFVVPFIPKCESGLGLTEKKSQNSSNFFCVRVINVWNSVPAEVNFNTINTFKRSLHCVDFSSFLRRYSL